jgi:hypothetical protein
MFLTRTARGRAAPPCSLPLQIARDWDLKKTKTAVARSQSGQELAGGVCARGSRASLCAGSAALLALPRWRRIALRTNGADRQTRDRDHRRQRGARKPAT